jgi:hypothetical protein
MAKGYAEGPAAEEAERRRESVGETLQPPRQTRVAVEASTPDDAHRHFVGWADEVDADELFASGRAWGIRLVRRVV